MADLGTALAAAVNGYIGGKDVKHRWQDRETDNERKKRLDQIRDNQERRDQQSHDMGLETSGLLNDMRGQSIRQTEREWSDAESMRGVLDAADKAATTGLIQPPPPALGAVPSGPSRVSTSNAAGVPAAPRQGLSRSPDGMQPQSMPSPMPQPQPQQRPALGAVPAQGGYQFGQNTPGVRNQDRGLTFGSQSNDADPLFMAGPDGKMIARRPARTREEKMQIIAAAKAGRLGVSDERAAQQAAIDERAQPQPQQSGTQTPFMRDMRSLGAMAGPAALTFGEQVANGGADVLDAVNAPFRKASEYFTGADHIGAALRVDLNKDGRNTSIVSPVFDALRPSENSDQAKTALAAEQKSGADKTSSAVSSAAANAMNTIGDSPAMKAAADGVQMDDLGVKPGRVMSPPQQDKLATTYMESYRQNGAPLVIKELMRQGRVQEAQQFDAFMRSQQAQEGMDMWMRGVIAAQSGDIDGAVDNLMDAYNNSGYFSDGYEVVKDESSLIRDKSGEVVGVNLTMRHIATGETFTQSDSITGFMEKAIWITSPEKAFAAQLEAQKAMQDALLKQNEKTNEAATDMIKTDMEAIHKAALEIYKASVGLDGQPAMTYDEALAAAQSAHAGGGQPVGQEETPVLRRSQ